MGSRIKHTLQWNLRIKDALGPAILSSVVFFSEVKNELLLWESSLELYGGFPSLKGSYIGGSTVYLWMASGCYGKTFCMIVHEVLYTALSFETMTMLAIRA